MEYTANFEIDKGDSKILDKNTLNTKSHKEAIYEIMIYAKNFSQGYFRYRNNAPEKSYIKINIFGLKDTFYQRELISDLVSKEEIFKFKFNEDSFKIRCEDLEKIVLKKESSK